MAFKLQIIAYGEEAPDQLLAHPLNAGNHNRFQRDAMEAVLEESGWADTILVNKRTGRILDGHMRVEIALKREEPSVPVRYVDVSEEEELKILATFDPVGSYRRTDPEQYRANLDAVMTTRNEIHAMLYDTGRRAGLFREDKEPCRAAGLAGRAKLPLAVMITQTDCMRAQRLKEFYGVKSDSDLFIAMMTEIEAANQVGDDQTVLG